MKILITNGLLTDPASGLERYANILIRDGYVEEITDEHPSSDMTLDASGCIVSPGFIDIHMHEDYFDTQKEMFDNDISLCMLRMGVTTMIGGNCGSNLNDPVLYLDEADRLGIPSNIGLFAGHSTIRSQITDKSKYDSLTPDEIAAMHEIAKKWIQNGCLGVSYGIRYVPGSTFDELLSTASACTASGKLLAAHIRDDAAYVFDSAKEFTELAKKAKVPAEISHIGSMAGFGQMKEFLEIIKQERKKGFPVYADCYPYYAFSTGIGETTYDDGFLERYKTNYNAIEICEGKYKGMRCTEQIFKELRANAPDTLTVCHVMRPADVDMAVCDPEVTIGSDGILSHSQGHPRAAGTFPKYLHDYVAAGYLPLLEGLSKITSLPAKRLGLKHRGTITPGSHADITVFNLNEIKDHSGFDHPVSVPTGIKAVFVNGIPACINNSILSTCAGHSVRT